MKILLIGWFGAGNMGDEAILVSEILAFASRIEKPEFHIISFDPERTGKMTEGIAEVGKIRRIGSKGEVAGTEIRGILRSFREADIVVIGGGGIFQDLYNAYPIPFFTAMAFLSRWNRKRLALYCVGIGPVRRSWGKKLCRYAADSAEFVSVRDPESMSLLREYGVSKAIHLSADPVFLLEPVRNGRTEQVTGTFPPREQGPVVGVCVQDLLPWSDANRRILASVLDDLAAGKGARIVFLPFGAYRDRWFGRGYRGDTIDLAATKRISGLMKTGSVVIPDGLKPQELLAVMQRMDLVITMRLHGAIMGFAAGVPVIALTYAEESKIRNLMKRLGQEESLFDVRSLSEEKLAESVGKALSGRTEIRSSLSAAVDSLRFQAEKCNDALMDMMMRGIEG